MPTSLFLNKAIWLVETTHQLYMHMVKEDFTKADNLGNDSVRRILDFEKTPTSFPPVSDKRLTSGTSETSTATNVQRFV